MLLKMIWNALQKNNIFAFAYLRMDKITAKTYHWGIIGLGKIARKFAGDLRLLPNARLHAVASTSSERAQAFANEHGCAHAFGSYEEIVNCPDLDVIYIATPHVLHYENTMMCLHHGIAVLCEKPFSMKLEQTTAMVSLAREKGIFLMEALWSLFIPGLEAALAMLAEGKIGELHSMKADFGYHAAYKPESRIFNRQLGGGALLDVGIYPALLAQVLFGPVEKADIQAMATFTRDGVDETCGFSFQYPGGKMALCHTSIAAHTEVEASFYGDKGVIRLYSPWHHTQRISLLQYPSKADPVYFDFPIAGWGYHFEAAHVMQCLADGKTESDRVPLDFTLSLTRTLDQVREKIGLVYE
jgi:predicted dehydrogenase